MHTESKVFPKAVKAWRFHFLEFFFLFGKNFVPLVHYE